MPVLRLGLRSLIQTILREAMTKYSSLLITGLLAALVFFAALPAHAIGVSFPADWHMNLQDPVTPVAERMHAFHTLLLIIIFGISGFVLALLVYVMVRFNAKNNPVPSKRTHNVPLEIIWTTIPLAILVIIAIPSIGLLYYADRVPEPDMTVKVTGYQWFWGYEYPDHDGVNFMSYMIPDDEIDPEAGQLRLLSTDNPVVIPINTNVQFIVTAGDVIHAWAVPAFGVKIDAVPGRLNETWARVTVPGTYFGQCSEICGVNHAFMPIEVRAVEPELFEEWIEAARQDFVSFDDFQARRQVQLAQMKDE